MYWNFGFLRVGTGGLAAQACGRENMTEAATVFTRGIGLAMLCSVFLIAIQWMFVKGALLLVDCSPEAAELSTLIFFLFCFGYMSLAPVDGNGLTAKGEAALHGLFLGYVAHLVMQALYLSAGYRKHILQKAA